MDKIEPVAEFTLEEAMAIAFRNAEAYKGVPSVSRTLAASVAALLSENARYKEALERISTLTPCEFASPSEDAAAAVRFARAALSAQEDA
jgi:hypothetical protein